MIRVGVGGDQSDRGDRRPVIGDQGYGTFFFNFLAQDCSILCIATIAFLGS